MVQDRPVSQPLGEEDLAALDAALEAATDVREVISRAKAAGLNVEEDEQRLDQAVAQARAIKQAFFPGR